MKTKIIAMYLPQYHETEENNRWWGEGFTDWVSTKNAEPLYRGHNQPRVPLDENYYDLSQVNVLKEQTQMAKQYGIDGFCFYHYWFSSSFKTLYKPAENYLQHSEIDFPFMFAWDNSSWIRTWSKFKKNANAWSPKKDSATDSGEDNGVLAQLEYGNSEDWKIHFDYLLPFFQDNRYIKVSNRPVFIFWNNYQKETLVQMREAWNTWAREAGFEGMYFITRDDPYKDVSGFDSLFNYEPQFSGWLNIGFFGRVFQRIRYLLGKETLKKYSYEKVWKKILRYADKHPQNYYGAFVRYDDTPRRGKTGKVIAEESPSCFEKYFSKLYSLSCSREKELLFLTAWNEWGEGAYLEPDTKDGFAYLEAVSHVVNDQVNKVGDK